MGVKFGEIRVDQILENEFRILVLERIVETLLSANPSISGSINVEAIQKQVIEELRRKYPKSGIALRGEGKDE